MGDICLLLVEPDAAHGRVQARLLTRLGYAVRLVQTRQAALRAIRRRRYAVVVVDLFLPGGAPQLARRLAPRVGRLVLCVGPNLARSEVLRAAGGFPVHRKRALTRVLIIPR